MHPYVIIAAAVLGVIGFYLGPLVTFWTLVGIAVVYIIFIVLIQENWVLAIFLIVVGIPVFGGAFIEKAHSHYYVDKEPTEETKKGFIVEYDYEIPAEVTAAKVIAIAAIRPKKEPRREPKPEEKDDSFSLLDWLNSKPLEHLKAGNE